MKTSQNPEMDFEVHVDHGVAVPMRDGVLLRADIYRPKAKAKFPVVIERTQGWRGEGGTHQCPNTGRKFASRGYVYLTQDVRGAFESQGAFFMGRNDGWDTHQDGYDTVEWAATQPWSNGNIAAFGTCGTGMTAIQLAPAPPAHLRTLFLNIPGAEKNYFYRSNVCRLSQYRNMAFWFRLLQLQHDSAPHGMETSIANLEEAFQNPVAMENWYRYLPLKSFPPAKGWGDWYFQAMEYPEDGPYWWKNDIALKMDEISVPIMHVSGWFDFALGHNLDHFAGIQRFGRTPACRQSQRLIVGPWGHLNLGERITGDLDFGLDSVVDIRSIQFAWFDFWLKGIQNEIMNGAPVKLFLMGENRWIEMETWPPPSVDYQCMYFREGTGHSKDSLNNGRLTFKEPSINENPDTYDYDPKHPIPSLANDIDAVPKDFHHLEGRMLTYTSRILDQPLRVVGPIKAILYGATSCTDTDWVVRLCDVWPDGRSISVCDGILRARFRNSSEKEEQLTPNQIYQFEVDLWATAQTFLPGHRLRVQVASSDFPRFDRNLNTGGTFGEEIKGKLAVNIIFHDKLHPSHIRLPILT